MTLTLTEIHARIFEGDPLADDPSEVSFDGAHVLAIAGVNDDSAFRHDLRMTQLGKGVMLETREHGTEEWESYGPFFDFDTLHTSIYEL